MPCLASPFAHALLVWYPLLLMWNPPLLMPCWCGIPFCSYLAGRASPFAHALFGIPLCSCLVWHPLAGTASPFTHALLVGHALLVMPHWFDISVHSCLVWHPFCSCLVWHPFCSCLASTASSLALVGLAPAFARALLMWHLLSLMPC